MEKHTLRNRLVLCNEKQEPVHFPDFWYRIHFYPSISEALLTLSLDYAKQFTTVSDEDDEIILHSGKTLLFNDNEPWVKVSDSPMCDVAMGSYDGAEACELVGLYNLHKLTIAFLNGNIGLYRGWWPGGI